MRYPKAKENLGSTGMIDLPPPGGNFTLPLRPAAREAGVSESTLRRLVADRIVPHVIKRGVQHVTRATIAELRTGGRKRGPSIGVRAQDQERGDTAADCFDRFTKGESLVEIVIALRVDPSVVESLWYKWKNLHKMHDGESRCMLEHRGGIECDGPPSAHTALCNQHAARARILSNDEEATLLAIRTGQEVATAVCCQSCGQMAARGLCTSCVSKITVGVDNGVFVVSIGERQVKVMQLEEVRTLLRGKRPPTAGAAPTAPAPAVDPQPEPVFEPPDNPNPMSQETRALLSEMKERLKTK